MLFRSDDGGAGSSQSFADQLRDGRNLVLQAPRPKRVSCRSVGTPARVASSTFGPEAGAAVMERQLAAANAPEYTWVDRWKGLSRGGQIPLVNSHQAQQFQNQAGDAQQKFQTDFEEGRGDPKFLRNQMLQRWVLPHVKPSSGVPIPWCAACGKEGWNPSNYFSDGHLKVVQTNPEAWENQWKFPKGCRDIDDLT